MGRIALLFLGFPIVASTLPATAEPFGLRIGEPVSNLHVLQQNSDGSYEISPPLPDNDFDSYSVFTTKSGDICKIVAASSDKKNYILRSFASVKDKFIRKYGQPIKDLDFCKTGGGASYCFLGSIHGYRNLTEEIRVKALVLETNWTDPADHIKDVYLRPYASSFHEAHLLATFSGDGAGECVGDESSN